MVKPTKRTGVFAKARCRSWFLTIREQRLAIQRHLRRHPSLHTLWAEALMDGFEGGIEVTLRETLLSLRVFPKTCPYTFEQVLAPTFLCDPTGDWDGTC
ncbi:MAG TPA: DUF29 domain-containing protein [Oscillatoriaceae cyanobacterium M7585_C2015_266]|nr:DUF29 domain-containing protein [Oscillatoriaceae cyanobacterium M7585_C2015_266]